MNKSNNLLTIVLVALLCIGGTYWYMSSQQKELEPPETPVEPEDPTILPTVFTVDGDEIQSGINEIGEFNTAEYWFSRVEEVNSVRQIDLTKIGINFIGTIPGTASGFTYKYDGTIKAGIDFKKVTVEVDDDNKCIVVHSPKAEILSSVVDEDSYEFYVKDNNLLNPIDPEEFAVSFADLIHKEEAKAKDSGLLKEAQTNAEKMLTNFVKNSLLSTEYTVSIEFE